ncbi:DgyrCDS1665 [Dimorphilus gyrociliatus]|uniref:DgyrCDS1665 n=1 Tax=Dimorphilus gyrociliatus TaxID=2664684 RepID=A0A7I8VA48_9ANNE|nr:DgyrCDS1665 [Dimorphilus gyrociliatus]
MQQLLTRNSNKNHVKCLQPTSMEMIDEGHDLWLNHSALFKAAEDGNINKVETILDNKPDWANARNNSGEALIHCATRNRQYDILHLLSRYKLDVDIKDSKGDTALLVATEEDDREAVHILLKLGADPNIPNKNIESALHIATTENRINIIRELLKCNRTDPSITERTGGTPLHVAAFKDNEEAAKLLLEAGAGMCKACSMGFTPMHVATMRNSKNVLQRLIQQAEASSMNSKGQACPLRMHKLPLHEAVLSGDETIVKMCLTSGASIDTKKANGETAVHIAASRGSVNILEILFQAQPDKKLKSLQSKDSSMMTPLHTAALFDKPDVIEYLIQQGADVNETNQDGMTPLLLAASKKAWKAMEMLMNKKADLFCTDDNKRNILHLIVTNGGRPEKMCFLCCKVKVKSLLNDQDSEGCTPLHYASRTGNFNTIAAFIDMGAFLNVKDREKQSPLHFAARYGRFHSCKRLLNVVNGMNILNELDETGQTPLHLASYGGHTRVVDFLLTMGASLQKDFAGNSPAHLAASSGYMATLSVLLDWNGNLTNDENSDGNTPLHLAALNGHASCVNLLLTRNAAFKKNSRSEHFMDMIILNEHKDAAVTVVTHERWREALKYCSSQFCWPAVGMIQHLPEVFQIVLDRCRQPSSMDRKHKDFHWIYSFDFLQLPMEAVRKLREQKKVYTPLLTLNIMVKYNRVDLLSHSVCQGYLQMKWKAYGMWIHTINLIFYLIFLASLSTFIATYDPRYHTDKGLNGTGLPKRWQRHEKEQLEPYQKVFVYIIIVFSCLNIIKEFGQMIQQKFKYFTDLTNAIEWTLYITSMLFIVPFVNGKYVIELSLVYYY